MPVAIVGGGVLTGSALERIEDAVVLIDSGRIRSVEPRARSDVPAGADIVDAEGATLLPGFIDAHVHIALAHPRDVLAGGVTSVRDLAWDPDEIWPLVARARRDDFVGPRIYAVGQMLTVEGGYPTAAAWAPPGVARVISGPDDADAAVAEQIERGAVAVKVALNAAAGPTLPPEALRAIVAAAHARRRSVTAHVTGLEELHKALDCGVDELAHMLMSKERIPDATIDRMAASVVVVPTLACRFDRDLDLAIDNLARFARAGGRIVYGTDLGNAGPRPGIDAREVAAMAAAGLSGLEIIASGTVRSGEYLGIDRRAIAPGTVADVIGVRGDPVADPRALTDVALVFRGGRRVG